MEVPEAVQAPVGAQAPVDPMCGGTQNLVVLKRKRLDVSEESLVEVRGIGEDLMILISQEKEKKKMTVGMVSSLMEIKRRYEEAIEEAEARALRLEGRLEEAKEQMEAWRVVVAGVTRMGRMEDRREDENKGEENETNMEVEEVKRIKKKKRKKSKKKEGQAPVVATKVAAPAAVSYASVVGKSKDDGVFTVVEKKKRKEIEDNRRKERRLAAAFIVEKGEGTSKEARDRLWSKIVNKVKAPQVGMVRVLPRGDILIKPADEATRAAMCELEREEKSGVKKETIRKPKVMLYDVERSVAASDIPEALARQNPGLGLSVEEARAAVKPLFMRGPREDPLVRWICEVDPSVYKSLVRKRWFLGLSLCRVVDFTEVLQCFACQGFGHAEAKCKRGKLFCSFCAVEGHRQKDCGEKGKAPKCVNCGLGFTAGHSSCPVRAKYERTCLVRTDYGSSSK